MSQKRLTWVDVTKGFLMILVVIGHYPGELDFPFIKYIYWFHMPAFFLLSGIFFKEIKDDHNTKKTIKKRFMQLMVPYLFFLFIITAVRYSMELALGNFELSWYLQDLWKLVIAGRFARGAYGVFWFVTTLFFTYLLFIWMTKYLSRIKQITLLVIFYLLAHLESIVAMHVISGAPAESAQTIPMLWNLDVVLMAIVYFSLGYYAKSVWMNVTLPWLFGALVVVFGAVAADYVGLIDYHLSMKFLRYDHFILDLLIPIAFIIVILGIFQRLTVILPLEWLAKVEKHSIAIMYLHIFTDIIMNDYFQYGLIGFTILGIAIPIIASIVIQKLIPYGKFFLGDIRAKKPIHL
ncbi:acyltransferase family protein [Psychrobacillus sp. OK032]|uniref:acyltransferase family protein n=1 Tax=Psychrobacillus sp. OK032 TaxID=1884358 RepID=UPI0008C9D7B7|nr:acyltransferase family protein [Psychrobacillus sp. OK032]SES37625.1 Fucose 4-O-acetylase [Psychrobacillus sp. OK032]